MPRSFIRSYSMYLWRRQATLQWWRAHQSALESRFGDKLALIAQPTRKRLQIQIALNSASRLRELVKIADGRIEKLPRDWLQRFQRQHKPKPIRIKDRQLIIPAGAAFGTGEPATSADTATAAKSTLSRRTCSANCSPRFCQN